MTHPAAFYCMSSELYFPGAVGLINSLRLVGHREPIYLLDCGLTAKHREALSAEATIVPGPLDVPPYLLKTLAPLAHPAETAVLIDVDMIVTRSLAPLLERARDGRVVAFEDQMSRFVPEWGEALGLGPARRGPYLSSGLVVLGGSLGRKVLGLWDEHKDQVDYELSYFERNVAGYPFLYLDQDILNAVLATRVDPARVIALERRLAPHQPYRGLRVLDESTLRCAYRDGVEPYVLHQYLGKPWLEATYHGAYSRLLARLLLGPDVAVTLSERELPLRMRSGPRALVERKRVDFTDLARWYARDVVPEWLRARTPFARRPGRE